MVVFSNEEPCHSEEGKQNQWEPAELVPAKPNDGFITWSDKSLMSDKKKLSVHLQKKKKSQQLFWLDFVFSDFSQTFSFINDDVFFTSLV